MPRSKGRGGRPWRRIRAQILAASQTCWICGHGGADTVDHVIPLTLGGAPLDPANLRPAHGVKGCPVCRRKCNSSKGNKTALPAPRTSRAW
ncbi:HNH endonuclease [Thermoactinospora rubra]|uniref:HNH endonuclease n=1 Tax=Thermoactinospora rubra TaxID=1088767 RepID=UPI000A10CF8C|nr:HNH endonuclease signature motif containing protein [Thermoactinospora rubra]